MFDTIFEISLTNLIKNDEIYALKINKNYELNLFVDFFPFISCLFMFFRELLTPKFKNVFLEVHCKEFRTVET